MENIRVRFAPSPTGYLHIGGARTALFNWLFAKKNNGKFVLRIEDTDTERLKADSVSQILTSLKWLGITWDEGPFFQSERLSIYNREVERLLDEGKAYYCYCSPQEIEAEREALKKEGKPFRYSGKCMHLTDKQRALFETQGIKPAIRLKVPMSGEVLVRDAIHGEVSFRNEQLDDFIIVKSNGIPTYNFACVVDDYLMNITHVIRAEEHLSNTPKQIHIYNALGYSLPIFVHIPMILAPDRSKLSKRHGATSVEEFKEQGYLSEAIVNYLTLLGWSPGNEEELFSVQETLTAFGLEKVAKKAAVYDVKKLTWMNGHYLNSLPVDYITSEAIPFFIKNGLIDKTEVDEKYKYIQSVVTAVRERVKTLQEIADASSYFFKDVTAYDEKGINKYFAKPDTLRLLTLARQHLENLDNFNLETTEKIYRELAEKEGIKAAELIHPTRLALTGRTMSPGLFDVMALLGKKRCIERLDNAIMFISEHFGDNNL